MRRKTPLARASASRNKKTGQGLKKRDKLADLGTHTAGKKRSRRDFSRTEDDSDGDEEGATGSGSEGRDNAEDHCDSNEDSEEDSIPSAVGKHRKQTTTKQVSKGRNNSRSSSVKNAHRNPSGDRRQAASSWKASDDSEENEVIEIDTDDTKEVNPRRNTGNPRLAKKNKTATAKSRKEGDDDDSSSDEPAVASRRASRLTEAGSAHSRQPSKKMKEQNQDETSSSSDSDAKLTGGNRKAHSSRLSRGGRNVSFRSAATRTRDGNNTNHTKANKETSSSNDENSSSDESDRPSTRQSSRINGSCVRQVSKGKSNLRKQPQRGTKVSSYSSNAFSDAGSGNVRRTVRDRRSPRTRNSSTPTGSINELDSIVESSRKEFDKYAKGKTSKEGKQGAHRGFFDTDSEVETDENAPENRERSAGAKKQTRRNGNAKKEDSSNESDGDESDVPCKICGIPDTTDANDIVFCDKCEQGYHQRCYGFPLAREIPVGSWLCATCFEALPSDSKPKMDEAERENRETDYLRSTVDFVAVWAMLWRMRSLLNIENITIPDLEHGLVHPISSELLTHIHVNLLKGLGKYFATSLKWPKHVEDLCCHPDWTDEFDEVWRLGLGHIPSEKKKALLEDEDNDLSSEDDLDDKWVYFDQPIRVRLALLRVLCDLQLVYNQRVIESIEKIMDAKSEGAGNAANTLDGRDRRFEDEVFKKLEEFSSKDMRWSPLFKDANSWKYILICDNSLNARLCRWRYTPPRTSVPRNPSLRNIEPPRPKTKRVHPSFDLSRTFHLKDGAHLDQENNLLGGEEKGNVIDLVNSDSPVRKTGVLKDAREERRPRVENSLLTWLCLPSGGTKKFVNSRGENSLIACTNDADMCFASKELDVPMLTTTGSNAAHRSRQTPVKNPLERWVSSQARNTANSSALPQNGVERWMASKASAVAPVKGDSGIVKRDRSNVADTADDEEEKRRSRIGWGKSRFDTLCATASEVRAFHEMMVHVDQGDSPSKAAFPESPLSKWDLSEDRQLSLKESFQRLTSGEELGAKPIDWHSLTSAIGDYVHAIDDLESKSKSKEKKLEKLQNTLGGFGGSIDLSEYAYEGEDKGERCTRHSAGTRESNSRNKQNNADESVKEELGSESESKDETERAPSAPPQEAQVITISSSSSDDEEEEESSGADEDENSSSKADIVID
eukprot:gb/GECG01002779.1/.p1 GENE.gb/GECG01002779.1/~~gb/GECG01002779.1/.p1  ORF type:complete len:1179 (+),score=197.98 gb/GECG01002779.1/:1-3537(+)